MNLPRSDDHRRWSTLAIGALAALLTAWLAARVLWAGFAHFHDHGVTDRLAALGDPPSSDTAEKPADSDSLVAAITKRNVFSPPAPKGFQGRLIGVLGDMAVFQGGQMAAVGEQAAGATVKGIGADWVEIEFEGKTQKLQVFAGGGAMRSGGRPAMRMRVTPRMIEQFKRMPEQQREQAKRQMPPEVWAQIENAMKGQP